MEHYWYLSVHLNNRLDWRTNTDAAFKGMSRLYFLRKLRSFKVLKDLQHFTAQSVVVSTIYCALICWGSSISPERSTGSIKCSRRPAE